MPKRQQFLLKIVQLRGESANQKLEKAENVGIEWKFLAKCWGVVRRVGGYKQGFCISAEVFFIDEGIEMMTIEQTNSEPQFPWRISEVSMGEDKIVASFKAGACRQRQHFARSGNAELAELSKKPNSI